MEKKERYNSEKEIDILPLLKALLLKLWLMLIVGIIIAFAVYGFTKVLIKPTYQSGFTAYVNNQHAQSDKSVLTNQDIVAAQQLTKTYSHIICSNSVLTASLHSINSDLTYKEFSRMVSTKIQDETELISVYVIHTDPQIAYELADAIAKTAPAYMSDIVEGSSMKIVDYPQIAQSRYGPSYIKYGVFGFIFGFLVIAVIEIIRFFKDDSIKNENELEQRFSLPVLGIIPDITQVEKDSNSYYGDGYGYGKSQAGKEEKHHGKQ